VCGSAGRGTDIADAAVTRFPPRSVRCDTAISTLDSTGTLQLTAIALAGNRPVHDGLTFHLVLLRQHKASRLADRVVTGSSLGSARLRSPRCRK